MTTHPAGGKAPATERRAAAQAEHTPGPWRVFYSPNGHHVIGIGELNGQGVADCGFGLWRGGDAESLANARLIAAAPETAAERDRLKAERDDLEERLGCMAGRVQHADAINAELVAALRVVRAGAELDDAIAEIVDAAISRATGDAT